MKTYHKLFGKYFLAACSIALAVGAQSAFAESFPLGECPVSGQELGSMGEPIVKAYDGREIRFCCEGCLPKFEADPASYIERIDAAIVEQQTPLYTPALCPVSGEKLGSMGDSIGLVYQNRLVRLCCKGCVKKFNNTPETYLEALDKSIVSDQMEAYSLETCIVSGEKLGGSMGDPVEYVFANRLVRLCCKGCVKDFQKNPAKYLAGLDKALSDERAGAPVAENKHDHGAHKHE